MRLGFEVGKQSKNQGPSNTIIVGLGVGQDSSSDLHRRHPPAVLAITR